MELLLVGGAGYIGSVTAEILVARGHRVTIFDNLSTGHRSAVPPEVSFTEGDLGSVDQLDALFGGRQFDAVMHFAAKSLVGESMTEPGRYFANNVAIVINLLNAMLARRVHRFVFSSSAAVYGVPDQVPITEDAPLRPNNPYGEAKAIVERMLGWYSSQAGLRYAALRYFNAAGASERYGEDHNPETHLIPLAIKTALGKHQELTVFGTDYPTPDGTAIRDYIHVLDLADAHIRALEAIDQGSLVCNLGNEVGYSVQEVLDAVRAVAGHDFPVTHGTRRAGDAPITVASAQRARETLGWTPSRGLEDIVESAWRWHRSHSHGNAE